MFCLFALTFVVILLDCLVFRLVCCVFINGFVIDVFASWFCRLVEFCGLFVVCVCLTVLFVSLAGCFGCCIVF